MESYTFPKRGELRAQLQKVWVEREYAGLVERLARQAGKTVSADGLVAVLSLAIEDFVASSGRTDNFRMAAYANLPAVIRALIPDSPARNQALNEYVALLGRLHKLDSLE